MKLQLTGNWPSYVAIIMLKKYDKLILYNKIDHFSSRQILALKASTLKKYFRYSTGGKCL